jgi:hypothetical protein
MERLSLMRTIRLHISKMYVADYVGYRNRSHFAFTGFDGVEQYRPLYCHAY